MYSRVGTRNGFTIVELLIVVVVIAILAAITIVAYNGIQNRAKISAVKSSLESAVKAVELYAVKNADTYPVDATTAGLNSGNGTTYEVSSNNTVNPKAYCVTVTVNGLTYFQTSALKTATPGSCMGMLAWWPFNGDARDASGNGVDGTVNGATPATGANGSASGAYQLGEVNQYIAIGTPTSFSNIPSAFTYSVWLARTGTTVGSQWPQIMGASDTHVGFGIRTSNYGVSVYFEWGTSPFNGSSFLGNGTTGSLSSLNDWHLMTATFDGSKVSTYWDGVLKSTSATTTLRPTMPSFSFTTSSAGWIGKIDDARVYNRALSITEIQTLYSAGAQ